MKETIILHAEEELVRDALIADQSCDGKPTGDKVLVIRSTNYYFDESDRLQEIKNTITVICVDDLKKLKPMIDALLQTHNIFDAAMQDTSKQTHNKVTDTRSNED